MENTEKALKPAPLFQVQMILGAVEIEFKPSLDKEAGDSFYDLIDELLSNIFKTSAKVKRMASHLEIQHYQVIYFIKIKIKSKIVCITHVVQERTNQSY